VNSDAERQRALALARETEGVTQVVDRLKLR
jgi:osmotically-inducible protein OsmY